VGNHLSPREFLVARLAEDGFGLDRGAVFKPKSLNFFRRAAILMWKE
jgi:hypothetical protein